MTVSTTANTKTYTGDNSTTEFSFPYLVYQSSHLTITLDGVTNTDWTAATYGAEAGVTVTFDTAPGTGVAIIIQRIVPYTQDTDLENFDGNPADVTEKQFDLLAMADQQIIEQVDRTIVTPIGTSLTSNEISGTIDTTTHVLTITTAGPASSTLTSIGDTLDTALTGLASGNLLQYNGANWVNITSIDTDELADNAVTTAKINDNAVTTAKIDSSVNAIGSIGGGTQDINLNSGRTVTATVDTSTTTFTFSNPKTTGNADAFDIYLTNGGSQTVNWPASVDWAGGNAPTLTTSGVDHLLFTTVDGGTTWYGYVAGLDMQ